MANTFQQRSRFRKLTYIGLIVVLFTAALLFRRGVIEPQAYALQLREQARGEVELTSSAVRLTLLGSRGLATSVLWQMAIERQKRHQWNEMELLVRSVTKLQPHFVSPWLFQSWNLAFNVAVECDRTRDKYFYISRGLQLLAEGERRHQGTLNEAGGGEGRPKVVFPGNPDMRFYLGMYYQLKIGTSDEKNAMRCLFDLSCIDPLKREPNRFLGRDAAGKQIIKLTEFEAFCRQNPRLVRRLRARLRCSEPRDVVEFLDKNRDIPSRFGAAEVAPGEGENVSPLLPPRQQFPILPPPIPTSVPLPDASAREFSQDVDVFVATRAWYTYAQEPLPPAEPNWTGLRIEPDPVRYRMPKIMLEIFRGYPARAQEYVAENLEDEGWFDGSGWVIPDWFDQQRGPDGQTPEVRVGYESKYWAGPAWASAHDMLGEYGRDAGLLIEPEQFYAYEKAAELYRRTYEVPSGVTRELSPAQQLAYDGQMGTSYNAHVILRWHRSYRNTTNFDDHYNQAGVEKLSEVVTARKQLFNAAALASRFDVRAAVREYETALDDWQNILLSYPLFRDIEEVQSETYEKQLRYLRLKQDQFSGFLVDVTGWVSRAGQVDPLLTAPAAVAALYPALSGDEKRRVIPIRKVRGPFEMVYVYDPAYTAEVGPVGTAPVTDMQSCLQAVTQAALPVPFVVPEYQRDRLLTAFTGQDRAIIPPQWDPLISEGAIRSVRDRLGLDIDRSKVGSE